ncbi:Alcohol oxidase [Paramyrothecium foliicola]|nr:Alcohol oxidase [Paramyrothecium foliicola]
MPLPTNTTYIIAALEWDIGAGFADSTWETAGYVVAGRLADTDRSLSILVVEGGPDNHKLPKVIHPALYRANFATDSLNNLVCLGIPEYQVAGCSIIQTTVGLLRGASSVNGAIYARGQSSDFDAWNTKRWSGKFEDYVGTNDKEAHGVHGPIKISNGRYRGDSLADDFLSAVHQGDYDTVTDLQNVAAVNSTSTSFKYVSRESGRR